MGEQAQDKKVPMAKESDDQLQMRQAGQAEHSSNRARSMITLKGTTGVANTLTLEPKSAYRERLMKATVAMAAANAPASLAAPADFPLPACCL